ncbi:Stem 28 kDa glycoprotein [Citrus sinensis]|uniref:Stem 28 kDa glycoprotein n=1 Tax=Citrus sinensis TaxID=2711 RepID=A0ACB8J8H0_CITSI|nr:Stem 28 kDa glycoprotein [Citrus sinensis]
MLIYLSLVSYLFICSYQNALSDKEKAKLSLICNKELWNFSRFTSKLATACDQFNSTLFHEWVETAKAPPLPESLKLYKKLLSLGIKIVFLTGRHEDQRNATETNLKHAGFDTWEKLILKGSSYSEETAVVHKSSERKKFTMKGYRIIGNIGDQWSDLLGTDTGNRAFKPPDPMYYIS